MTAIPVIALTGYLGAGKTSLLNHVLRAPGARIGVVINDFGELNVDAALVTGQVDEPASITGGCICCLPDEGGLDEALEKLTDPRLELDAIIVEASGLADPIAISRIIRYSGVERVRHGRRRRGDRRRHPLRHRRPRGQPARPLRRGVPGRRQQARPDPRS